MNSNYYKYVKQDIGMRERGKKGQMAIFIIVALVIVALILVIFLYPRVKTNLFGGEFSANSFLKSCLEPELKPAMELLNKQGGYSNPEGFLLYKDEKVKYLCYVSEYYQTCVVQDAMIKTHYEQELNVMLNRKANECARSLKSEYERRGYSVTQGNINSRVEIIPGSVEIKYEMPMSVSKEETKTYQGFNVGVKSEMYDLLLITQSIIEYESIYGDSETTLYLQYYPDLKIEKTKLSEGSKVYILSNSNTKESFRFASRSLSWPPGYRLQ